MASTKYWDGSKAATPKHSKESPSKPSPKRKSRTTTSLIKEADIQRAIVQYLKQRGYFYWRSYIGPIMHRDKCPSPNPMAGFPDLSGFSLSKPHKFWCLEVKRKGGRCTPNQKLWHQRLRAHGVFVEVVVSLDEAITFLTMMEHS